MGAPQQARGRRSVACPTRTARCTDVPASRPAARSAYRTLDRPGLLRRPRSGRRTAPTLARCPIGVATRDPAFARGGDGLDRDRERCPRLLPIGGGEGARGYRGCSRELGSFLRALVDAGVRGLPVGPDPSAILANGVLAHADRLAA